MSTHDPYPTRQRWRCGEYRIELAAPRLWVNTRQKVRKGTATPRVGTDATTGRRSGARGIVTRLHRKHCAARSLVRHIAGLALIVAIAAGLSVMSPAMTVPAVLIATVVAFRTSTKAVELLTGRSWEHVSQTYQ